MAPETRSKFGAPLVEPEVFLKQMYCTEEFMCDNIVGTFRRPPQSFDSPAVIWRHYSDSAPGDLCPLGPRGYAPAAGQYFYNARQHSTAVAT